MKTITIHVPEGTYGAFQEEAARRGVSASELIRNAMEEYYAGRLARRDSIFDHEPAHVGEVIRPFSREDDLLDEMLG